MRHIVFITFLLLMASVCYAEKYVTLSAPPGHDEIVEHTLKFSSGKVEIRVSGQTTIVIATKLQRVIPYISVSSGEARFEVALTKQRNTDNGVER